MFAQTTEILKEKKIYIYISENIDTIWNDSVPQRIEFNNLGKGRRYGRSCETKYQKVIKHDKNISCETTLLFSCSSVGVIKLANMQQGGREEVRGERERERDVKNTIRKEYKGTDSKVDIQSDQGRDGHQLKSPCSPKPRQQLSKNRGQLENGETKKMHNEPNQYPLDR